MDLFPKPDQVVAALGNVTHALLHGGVADLRAMPRTLIDEGEAREVYHYRPDAEADEDGDPVLLVTPLAAPSVCYDLRRGCSLVEHLVSAGRPTYLVEYGTVSFRNRNLGMEHWVDTVLPTAIAEVSAHAGGRPVHLVAWSLGGIFALLTAADGPDLPIASLSVLGSPVDIKKVPVVAPARPLLNLTEGRGLLSRAYRALGGLPVPIVSWALTAASAQKVVSRPLVVLSNLDDADLLAQLEAVDRFMAGMTAYPGRTFGQLYHRFVKGDALASGSMEVGDRNVSLADITVPVLVFGGNADTIAPIAAVEAVVPLLTGAREVQFEVVPGGHLGMLTGRGARDTTWRAIDEWVTRWTVADPPRRKSPAKKTPAKKAAAKKAPAKQAGTKKAPAKKGAAKKSTPTKTASPRKSIGTNPTRRHGSADSRALSRPGS